MRQFIFVVLTLCFPFLARGQSLVVVDEQGKPVDQFEVMFHTTDMGYHPWKRGGNGSFVMSEIKSTSYFTSSQLDVLVKAQGYAATTKSYSGEALQDLERNGAKITLERGREVHLKLRLPKGMEFPEGFSPELFFDQFAWRVVMMWQPANRRERRDYNLNMLGVKPVSGSAGEYTFRLGRDKRNFFVAIYHPGWLRYFNAGPFSSDDAKDDQLIIDVPQPCAIVANVDWGKEDIANLPFSGLQYDVMWQQRQGGDVYSMVAAEEDPLDGTLEVRDLAPGSYMVTVRTKPQAKDGGANPEAPDPGRFYAIKMLKPQAGEIVRESLRYVAFDPNAWRGDRTVRLRVTGADGLPAAGKQLKISWYDGHYGSLPVFDGPIPADGVVTLEKISSVVEPSTPFGPYTAQVDGERVAFFRVRPTGPAQELSIHLTPKAGDTAPDVVLVPLDSEERMRLKDFRGQIVYLEFWTTGCGPCQPAMAKLDRIMAAQSADWKGKVALVPLCLDREPEIISKHVKSRGWTNLRHYGSDWSKDEYFADAATAFVVHSYPTAILIDPQGKIVWRGHPSQSDLVKEVQKLQRLNDTQR